MFTEIGLDLLYLSTPGTNEQTLFLVPLGYWDLNRWRASNSKIYERKGEPIDSHMITHFVRI